jgi:cell division protein FtsI/penicillin-binding protein 2
MKDHYSDRKYIIGTMMVIPVLFFIVRLFVLQVIDPSYKMSADSNVLRHVTQYPSRGLIYDRNGEILVFNEPVYDLMVVPSQLALSIQQNFAPFSKLTKSMLTLKSGRQELIPVFARQFFLSKYHQLPMLFFRKDFTSSRVFMSSPGP